MLDAIKKQEQKNNALDRIKQAEEKHVLIVNTVEIHMNPRGAQPMGGTVQDVGNST